ncbi:MAG: glycosyltransferase [Ferruginibacter sp.]|nr:glycosyltransferase [Bacteroidota bacterium]MBX2919943.1 glycosyltransferase [Ferruginibacter sp.]MCB0710335.1 glycosyltransferase [Chitinophagaceae bacterium]MCC7378762.1 glycosyltransferase [Chitinophagaceae bacterium]
MGGKKIIIIGSAHPLRGGGIATFNERLARQFTNEGFNTKIYSFTLQYPGFLFPGKSQFTDEPAPHGLNIISRINSINPFNWIKVGREIKKLKPDIVVVRYWIPFMGPCLGSILRIIKKNKHSKIICIADNVIPHEKRLGDKIFTRYFIKPVDAFIIMSKQVMNDLRSFTTTKKAILLPHPLYDNFGDKISKEEARKNLGLKSDDAIILFFGFIRKYKGLDILLDAMQILSNHQQTKNIKLLIAGEFYDDNKPYIEQIKKTGIIDNLILHTNFIKDSDVKKYLCAADVVIQPYRNATQSGVTPLAYHFEVPMIVTNVGGLPAMVPHDKAGLVAEPNAISIAEKITEYFKKGENYFLPQLIEEKKKLSWAMMTASILELANND